MNTKFLTFLIAGLIATAVFSQNSINNYKYIIVPRSYNFLKEANQYQLNALTQFLFNKHGFEAFMEGSDYPEDLIRNRCLALNSDLIKESGLFKTKLILTLKDCNGQAVFTSKIGESREKDYKSAYNLALRDAFESIEALDYNYKPIENSPSMSATEAPAKNETAAEIEQLKQEIKKLKGAAKIESSEEVNAAMSQKKQKEIMEMVESRNQKGSEIKLKISLAPVLYAQKTENGFQLIDTTPKVVYKIKKTGQENLFLVEGENAVIYKQGDNWIYEYNTDEGVKQKELNIKF
ncbi:hypothetical protein [Flavisericum labens]|uniref:hypothetical protein n=1 Tax=Flavisericum labens TaxID=3377112 RepID=UPI00387B671D